MLDLLWVKNKLPASLDKQFSWPELAEEIAKRIGKTYRLKGWKKEKFVAWFMEREKLGLNFDWRLVCRAYVIWQQLQDENDHFTVCVGPEGSGKTTLMTNFCAWVAPSMQLEHICFNMPQYIDKLQNAANNYWKHKKNKEDQSIEIDEGGIDLFSREAMTVSNRVLAKTFMVQRFINMHIGINIPFFWALDSLVRDHRIKTLIIVKKRSKYKCVIGKGIKILNKNAKKDKIKDLQSLPIPYEYFWDGDFGKEFPKTIDKAEYERHKFRYIKKFLEDAKLEASAVKMIKVARLEKEIGVSTETIIRGINKGEIEGHRIGKQWFISKRAYNKIIMAENPKKTGF